MSNIEDVSLKEFHYCIICKQVFPSNVDMFCCGTTNCEGLRYKGPLSSQQKKGRQPLQCFLFTDIKEQLTDLLQTPGIWDDIQFNREASFERKNNGSKELTDITDGASYRAMMGDGLFLDRTKNNLTAIFNTDGVSLYSSSKIELWPIFLAINELSPMLRFARENILLMGLWQGKGKPPFQSFLKIFSEEMNTIYNDGVEVTIEEETYTVKLSVLCCITDLPAKAETLNMSYFNGEYACITCTEPGLTVAQGKGHTKCFPYRNAESRYSRRSDESIIINMNEGSNIKRSKGFKGMSELANLQSYNIVDGTVPDYMRMKNIKPPSNIERLPRDLEKHYQHFKATELQTWLLYYSIPCVRGFLEEEYMKNLVCFAEAIYILLGDSITPTSLEHAVDLLNQFYASFQRLDLKKTTSWKVTIEATNCDVAGATKKLGNSENWVKEQIALFQQNTCITNATKVDRIMVNNKKYCSEGYSRMQKRICNIVRIPFRIHEEFTSSKEL
ncbi:hypothetical protein KUTeg_011228 [Tegillarca granosa]|uniref:Uncharacterized protein n=1 Tax=Tegillarca granosa TaxID=220873 RepID=A0ABQ9F3S9_TEGGR|nr:hypothetical protein KUTeg_011228 [Tegillarca granosa]